MEPRVVRYYSDKCIVCGVENPSGFRTPFYSDGTRVWADLCAPAHTRGFGGVVHGGLVTAILDEAMFYAVYAGGTTTMTVHLNVTLRRPVPPEAPLRVEGWLAGDDRRYRVARAALYGADGTLLAEGEGRFLRVPRLESHLQGTIVVEEVPTGR